VPVANCESLYRQLKELKKIAKSSINHLKTKRNLLYIRHYSPYRAVNTFHHGYKKPVT